MPSYGTDTFIWTGVDRLQAVLRNVSPRATEFLGTAMEDVMADVYDQSQAQVPVDTGSLRSSGHLDPADVGPGKIMVTIGYGAPYAWYVHENLSANHPHGKAKYLEDPMRSALDQLTTRLEGRMEAAIVGGGVGSGSRNMAQESAAMSSSVNRRSLSQRRSMSSANVEKALMQMRREGMVAPDMRSHFVARRGKLSRSWAPAPKTRFNYDPTRSGRSGSLHWPGT